MTKLPNFQNTEIAFQWQSNAKLWESYLVFRALGVSPFVDASTKIITAALKFKLPITALVRHTVFRQFCGGINAEDSLNVARRMATFKVGSILDYSVEALNNETDFEHVTNEVCATIRLAKSNPESLPMCVFKVTGTARFALLERYSAHPQSLTTEEHKEWARVVKRITKICELGAKSRIPILIDAEESWIQQAIDDLALAMMRVFNREECVVYNTLQMYRHDRYKFLQQQHEIAKQEGFFYGAKFVRGAYMEKERERAANLGLESPIQPDKKSTDRDFDAALEFALNNIATMGIFVGSHNEKSTATFVRMMQEKSIANNHPRIMFSQLFGMSDNLSYNLAASGYRVAKYLPYGPVKTVLPYLFRRAKENTSIQGQAGRELQLISRELKRRGIKK